MNETNRGWNIKAIVLGVLADIGGTIVATLVIGIVVGIMLASRGLAPAQIQQQITTLTGMSVLGLIVGAFFSALGGYVAANIAAGAEMRHALATGVVALLLGLLFALPALRVNPTWTLLGLVLTVPAALLGGWLRLQRPRRAPPGGSSGSPPIPAP